MERIKKHNIDNVENGNYKYNFPLAVFCIKKIKKFNREKDIKRRLKRNIYFNIFNNDEKKLLIKRIKSLNNLLDFIFDVIKRENPDRNIITVYAYGSYLYGRKNYKPDDIDLGVIVDGSIFKYICGKIQLPSQLAEKFIPPVRKINLFIYGEDNMVRGLPVDDTVFAGLIHKQATKRELSVAYWRNIVIWGKDFRYIEGNKKNSFVTLARMINGCHERLLRYERKDKRENKITLFNKVTTRLIEINVFLEFFRSGLNIKWRKLFNYPGKILRNEIMYQEIIKLYKETLFRYSFVKKELF